MFAKALCLTALFIYLFVPSASEATDVSGSITSNTVWTAANSPYHVVGNVTVFPGFTLTVEPGVTVNVDPGLTISIRGTISGLGTSGSPITLQSSAPPAHWFGLVLESILGAYGEFAYVEFSDADFAILQGNSSLFDSSATVSHCTFDSNMYGLGGYSGYDMIVTDCVFTGNQYGVTSADKVLTRCLFTGNDYGLYQTERVDLDDCDFNGNGTAVYGGRGLMEDCTITGSTVGVQGFYQGFTMHRNVITDNATGVQFTTDSGVAGEATFNDIFGNTLFNGEVIGSANVSAPNNWWGTTNTTLIDTGIYDGYDNPSRGLLLYQPFSTQPNVGATPVRPTSWGRVKQLFR